MLQPKKTKYRKAFKGRIHGSAKGGFSLPVRSADCTEPTFPPGKARRSC